MTRTNYSFLNENIPRREIPAGDVVTIGCQNMLCSVSTASDSVTVS